MPLGPIIKTPPVVWLVPTSGIQFIDFGFTLARSKDLPTQWSFYDDPKASPVPLVVGRAGQDPDRPGHLRCRLAQDRRDAGPGLDPGAVLSPREGRRLPAGADQLGQGLRGAAGGAGRARLRPSRRAGLRHRPRRALGKLGLSGARTRGRAARGGVRAGGRCRAARLVRRAAMGARLGAGQLRRDDRARGARALAGRARGRRCRARRPDGGAARGRGAADGADRAAGRAGGVPGHPLRRPVHQADADADRGRSRARCRQLAHLRPADRDPPRPAQRRRDAGGEAAAARPDPARERLQRAVRQPARVQPGELRLGRSLVPQRALGRVRLAHGRPGRGRGAAPVQPAPRQRGRQRHVQPQALPLGRGPAPRRLALQQRDRAARARGLRHRRRVHDAGQRLGRAAPHDPADGAAQRRFQVPVDAGAVRPQQPDDLRAGRDLPARVLHDERAGAPAAPPQRRPAAPAAADHHDHADRHAAGRAADPAQAGAGRAGPRVPVPAAGAGRARSRARPAAGWSRSRASGCRTS